MSFLAHLDLLTRMDQLIRRKSTGTPQAFAQRLGISTASLYRHLDHLAALGASVVYCRLRQTFYYETEGRLYVAFVSQGEEGGGKHAIYLRKFFQKIPSFSDFEKVAVLLAFIMSGRWLGSPADA